MIPPQKRSQQGLKVRQSTVLGVYVEGLSKHASKDYKSIENIMAQGNKNRTIGATQMNATSSRAHTIIMIEFTQIATLRGKKAERRSVINLVDLAGSEKVG